MSDSDKSFRIRQRSKTLRLWLKAQRKASKGGPVPVDTGHTLSDLQALERSTPRSEARPKTVHLAEINLALSVFQHRIPGSDPLGSAHHVKRLTDDINNFIKGIGTAMSALVVTMIGDRLYLVEGHHRYEAFLRSKWQKKVRVVYFEGNVVAARAHSLACNLTGKLAITNASRSEAAWKLVQEGNLSKDAIAKAAGRSPRLVAMMRKCLSENEDLRGLAWVEAIRGGGKREAPDHEAAAKAHADMVTKVARRLCRNMGPKFPYSPAIFAAALASIDEELPDKLIHEWAHRARKVVRALDAPGLDI